MVELERILSYIHKSLSSILPQWAMDNIKKAAYLRKLYQFESYQGWVHAQKHLKHASLSWWIQGFAHRLQSKGNHSLTQSYRLLYKALHDGAQRCNWIWMHYSEWIDVLYSNTNIVNVIHYLLNIVIHYLTYLKVDWKQSWKNLNVNNKLPVPTQDISK